MNRQGRVENKGVKDRMLADKMRGILAKIGHKIVVNDC